MLTEYAKREEIPEIAAFIDSAWRAAYINILAPEYLALMRVEERIKGLLERFYSNHSQFLRMRDDNEIVGVAVFGKSITDGYPDDGEVSALYLRLDCIGKGYGYALLVKAETALAEMGYKSLVLDVFTENERAVNFYKAHGYKQIDEKWIEFGGKEYPYTVFRKKNEDDKTPRGLLRHHSASQGSGEQERRDRRYCRGLLPAHDGGDNDKRER